MNRTAAEALEECVRAMGQDLGEIFSALSQQTALIHAKWNEYVVLYGIKESRVALLNQAAPRFSGLIQDVLWDDILLHLARLTDSPTAARRLTLSVRALPDRITDSVTKLEVTAAVEAACAACKFCRDWRNRRLAHLDLAHALNPKAQPLTPTSRQDVKLALKSLADTLNIVSQHYLNSTSLYEVGSNDAGGALSLLHLLHDGVRTQEARAARLKSGSFDRNDLPSEDL